MFFGCKSHIVFTSVVAIAAIGLSGAAPPGRQEAEFEFEGFRLAARVIESDDEDAGAAIRNFQRVHDKVVASLLIVIDADKPPEPNDRRPEAAATLARLRCRKAIPILLSRINSLPRSDATGLSPISWFPYAAALVEYREEAVPEILYFLKRSGNKHSDVAIALYGHVLQACATPEGRDINAAIAIIEREIAVTPPDLQQGLQQVLARLQTTERLRAERRYDYLGELTELVSKSQPDAPAR
jgi:hypothetical protein